MNTYIILCIIWMNYKCLKKGHGGSYPPHPPHRLTTTDLEKRLTWATHIKNKRSSLNLKLHKFKQLLRSNRSTINFSYTDKLFDLQ
jgi:hypothetical protein